MNGTFTIPRWLAAVVLGAMLIMVSLLVISMWDRDRPPEPEPATSGAEAQAEIDAAREAAESEAVEATEAINAAETDEEYRDAAEDIAREWWD